MKRVNTRLIIESLNSGEPVDPSIIRRMVAELEQHRINELVTEHFQGRIRAALHGAG